jgi:polysaccharide biosynthesis transport protein
MKYSPLIKYSPDASRQPGAVYAQQFAPAIDCVSGEASVPIGEYLEIVRRQLWKILLFVVASVVATYFVSLYLKPTYRAVAVIDIDRFAPSGVVGEEPSRRADINDADEFLLTQVRLIQSNAVLRPVAEKYRLFQPTGDEHSKQPDFEHGVRPTELSGLKVKRQPNTYLILISYDSHDPILAANVANAIASSYIQSTLDVRARSSAGLSSFMEKQLDELKTKMERSEQALAKFKSEFDVIDPAQKTNILSSRLLQLNTEYTAAQVDRVRKESTYNSILSGSLEAAQLSGQGEELGKLVDQLNEVTQHFAEVKTTYGSNHPEYQKAASRLTELQDQVIQTRKNIFNRVALDYKGWWVHRRTPRTGRAGPRRARRYRSVRGARPPRRPP